MRECHLRDCIGERVSLASTSQAVQVQVTKEKRVAQPSQTHNRTRNLEVTDGEDKEFALDTEEHTDTHPVSECSRAREHRAALVGFCNAAAIRCNFAEVPGFTFCGCGGAGRRVSPFTIHRYVFGSACSTEILKTSHGFDLSNQVLHRATANATVV